MYGLDEQGPNKAFTIVCEGPVDAIHVDVIQLNRAKRWELKLCWLPKKCYLTGKPLWGKLAYHGERWITGPGSPVVQHYWIDKHEFLIWQLKQ